MNAKNTPRIAQTLSNLGLVKEEDIAQYAANTRDNAEFLNQIFAANIISSKAMSKELASRFGSPLFDVSAINPEVVPKDLIDQKIVERHFAFQYTSTEKICL